MADTHALTQVTARAAAPAWKTELTAGRHALVADEPADLGGQDAGAAPFHYVLAGLAACTSITLRMYAQRKDIVLSNLVVEATLHHQPDGSRWIDRVLTIEGGDEAQRARMAEIAEKTPVTLALKGGMDIRTRMGVAA